jgi:hypothetical protein
MCIIIGAFKVLYFSYKYTKIKLTPKAYIAFIILLCINPNITLVSIIEVIGLLNVFNLL